MHSFLSCLFVVTNLAIGSFEAQLVKLMVDDILKALEYTVAVNDITKTSDREPLEIGKYPAGGLQTLQKVLINQFDSAGKVVKEQKMWLKMKQEIGMNGIKRTWNRFPSEAAKLPAGLETMKDALKSIQPKAVVKVSIYPKKMFKDRPTCNKVNIARTRWRTYSVSEAKSMRRANCMHLYSGNKEICTGLK
ncbi:hypothetical protein SUGI_0427190 [Cryptomeria japonica]|nr:hypothetical protein SUGI_0427190 [Cryptomeria japonica]